MNNFTKKEQANLNIFESYTGTCVPIKKLTEKNKLEISQVYKCGLYEHITNRMEGVRFSIREWIIEANKKIEEFKEQVDERVKGYGDVLDGLSDSFRWSFVESFIMQDKTIESLACEEMDIYKKMIYNQERCIKYLSSIEYYDNIRQRVINIEIQKTWDFYLENEFNNTLNEEEK